MTFRDSRKIIIIALNFAVFSCAAVGNMILFNGKTTNVEEGNQIHAKLEVVDYFVNILIFNLLYGFIMMLISYFVKSLRFKMLEYSYLNNQTKKEYQAILENSN